nr:hypothetical protein [Tanacetum cinerariifolium]
MAKKRPPTHMGTRTKEGDRIHLHARKEPRPAVAFDRVEAADPSNPGSDTQVVRIPLEGDEILRVHGERTQGVIKTLMTTKVDEPKLSGISIVRDFIDVFLEVVKPAYRLAPSEMQELSEQLRELQDKDFI